MRDSSRPAMSLPLLLRRSLLHRRSRTLAEIVALTVSAAVATALLTLYASLDQKLHHQFRAFGANIVITDPASKGDAGSTAALPANAMALAQEAVGPGSYVVPFAYAIAETQTGTPIVVAGTRLELVREMNTFWQVSRWPQMNPASSPVQALVGARAAQMLHTSKFSLTYNGHVLSVETAGILRTGDVEDSRIYLPLDAFVTWTGVSPNTLEIQAAGSQQQIQAILTRLRQAFPAANVHAVHQLVEAEANVISRTRSLLLSSLVLISLTVAICVLATLTASVLERRRDFAVMKALGASQHRIGLLFLLETLAIALTGLACGYALGCAIAWLIGQWNFHTSVFPVWSVVPQVALLNLLIALFAAAIPLRTLRRLEPATLLRGE